MRQARIAASDRFIVEEVFVPSELAEGEVLLRTAVCGICSGDLMPWYLQKKVGTVLGHEVVGWAAKVGEKVRHIKVGDLVFVHHHAPCLECACCRRGDHVHCPEWKQSKLDPGGMAEWIRVPAGIVRNDAFAVNDLTAEQAVFIEPLGCCAKAIKRIVACFGGTPRCGVVVGCGVMGLLNLAAARVAGVQSLYAVEPDGERRRLAQWFADAAVFTPEEAAEQLRQRADFVIVGPGHPEVIRQSLAYIRPGGCALLFTPTPTGETTALDLGELYFREISIVPSYSCGPDDTRQAYTWLRRRSIQPEKLVTHRFGIDQVQQAYETARSGGSALKILVAMCREKP
ncbi:MAG: sorbitol dehydrogenase [Gemmatales bacterium]|nr:MAG: sorbitol dehydrogenase [Gemmatales bacterium]